LESPTIAHVWVFSSRWSIAARSWYVARVTLLLDVILTET